MEPPSHRPEHCIGAHARTAAMNRYIGICLIGDFSLEDRPYTFVDKETGVGAWFKPFTVEYDFAFAGVGKKGGY